MYKGADNIPLHQKSFLELPLCEKVEDHEFWGHESPVFQCGVVGCRRSVEVDYNFYDKGYDPNWKQIGCDDYDSNSDLAVIGCRCETPVCDKCAEDPSCVKCKICRTIEDIGVLPKEGKMKRKNRPIREINLDFVCSAHTVANDFIEKNLGPNWLFFVRYYRTNGRVIDITKINTDEMCEIVSKFKLFCLNWGFLKSTSVFTKRIPLASVASIFNPHFEKFMRESAGFLGSLRIIIFRKKDLERYRFFGFMMKMIAKITRNSVVLMGGRESQVFATCFRRFYARLLLT